jgi:hypothetical protein
MAGCGILVRFELTLRSRFSPSLALVLTLAFVAGALGDSPALSAESRGGFDDDIKVTADFDGDGTLDSATLHDNRIALSLSEQRTTIQLHGLADTTTVAVTDIDRDGDTDLVSIDARGSLRGWNNEGSGSFAPWTVGAPSGLPSPTWAGTPSWSSALAVLPSILSGRSPSAAALAMRLASLALRPPPMAIGAHSDRAPTNLGFAEHSPRAPPQTFIS